MKRNTSTILVFFLGMVIQSLCVPKIYAFYEYQTDQSSIELSGLVRGFGMAWENPEDQYFYEDRSDSGMAGLLRLMAQAQSGQYLTFNANVYQTHIPTSMVSSRGGIGTSLDVERSAALEESFSQDSYTHLAVDQLNTRWSQDRVDLSIGRQPINLATTFYFTPNDFFAPFSAQAFYRVYKPGVDAARADIRLTDLSQFSLISVLGYDRDPGSDTGWSEEPNSDRISYIARIFTVFCDFDWSLLGGVVQDRDIIGGSLQGELFQWLGIRAEGHWADPEDVDQESYMQVSVGFEHRWENSLNIRLEQFHNDSGVDSVSAYGMAYISTHNPSPYLAQDYTALGMGYELTPLLNAEILAIRNWLDDSCLISANAVYSLSDEAELTINGSVPVGEKPDGPIIRSEFGLYPAAIQIEIRLYF
jgi:hypothetical protein